MRVVDGLAFLTAEEMAREDKEAIEVRGIGAGLLMENAGGAVAEVGRKMLGRVEGKLVVCLVGKGNNGGDGLVAARRLWNWGATVRVIVVAKGELRDLPAEQMAIVERMGIPISGLEWKGRADLVVDAVLGYGSKGDPRGLAADLVRSAAGFGGEILAADLPSGLDATTGEPKEPCVKAKATVTFGYPKSGFLNPKARKYVGELYLADISLPRKEGGMTPFGEGSVVRVW